MRQLQLDIVPRMVIKWDFFWLYIYSDDKETRHLCDGSMGETISNIVSGGGAIEAVVE